MDRSKVHHQTDTPFTLFKFCPGCGSDSFSPKGDNSLSCAKCHFTYYVNPPVSVVAILRNDKDQILLTQRKHDPAKGKFDFPGGFVDAQETLEEALTREIKEELNLDLLQCTYFTSAVTEYPFKGLTYYPVDAIFQCTVKNWQALTIRDDVAAIRFCSLSDINEDDLAFDSVRRVINKLKKMR